MNSFSNIPQNFLDKWQGIADLLAKIINVPAALIMKTENEYMEVFISSRSENNPYKPGDKEHWAGLYCETVIKSQKKLLIPNALKDKDWDKNPDIKLGMIAYLGLPLNFPDKTPFGTICVLNNKENYFTKVQEQLLSEFKNVIELDLALIRTLEIDKSDDSINELLQQKHDLTENINEYEAIYEELRQTNDELLQTKQKAEESEAKFKGIFNHANIGIATATMNGTISNVNKEFKNLLGYSEQELLKMTFKDFTHPEDLDKENELIHQLLTGEIDNYRIEKRYIHKKGGVIWVDLSIAVMKDDKGDFVLFIGMVRDITEQKKAEQEIKYRESLFNNVLDTIPDMVSIHDKDLNILYSNWNGFGEVPFDCRKFNTKCYKTYRNYDEICPDCQAINVLKTKTPHHSEAELPDNSWIDLRVIPLIDEKGECNMFVEWVRDISDLKDSEKQLKEQNEEYLSVNEELRQTNEELYVAKNQAQENESMLMAAMENSQAGIAIAEVPSGKLKYVNNAGMFIRGKSEEEIVKNIDVDKYVASWQIMHFDGTPYKPDEVPLARAVLYGEKNSKEFIVRRENNEDRYVWANAAPIHNHNGEQIAAIVVFLDITDRKLGELKLQEVNTELLKAKDKAEESDRLKTEFINNMSHEIRTPMNGIIGFSKMLDKPDISDEKRTYYSKIVQNSSQQLLRIIDDILAISTLETKQEKIKESEFGLNDVLMELFSVFNLKSKERNIPIYIKKALHDEQSYIISDKAKINKIISNLLENAIKYTIKGFIELGYYIENQHVVLYVKDTGIGIAPENHKVIFERFSQEDKEVSIEHGGLGLGLSISKENAQLLGGDITLESEKGKGSTFYVSIPYKPALLDKENNKTDDTSHFEKTDNKYTILLAEDEEVNYLYICELFEDEIEGNYNLIHAKNGQEAVEICTENKNIDLVLMDIKMPIMNGHKATEIIKEKFPNLPIIAQTAYSTESDKQLALNHGCDDFISKPIDIEKLSGLIYNYLNI